MRQRQRRTIVLAGLCAVLALVVASPACLFVPIPPLYLAPEWVKPEGSCMCSVCWNQPFCWDPALPEGAQFYGTPPCADTKHEAGEALRIVDAVHLKDGTFFCWAPFKNAEMNDDKWACPPDEEARANRENLDPCVDLPECARPVVQCGGPVPDPACPGVSQTARTSACVEVPNYDPFFPELNAGLGAIAGVDALVENCALHGVDPPSGPQPERYCYLSCITPDTCDLDAAPQRCVGCDGNWYMTAGPEQGGGAGDAFPVDFPPGMAVVTFLMKDENDTFQQVGSLMASGRAHFRVPATCQGPNVSGECKASMTRLSFAAIGTLTLQDQEVANVRLINAGEIEDTFVTRLGEGAFSMSRRAQFGLTGDFAGQEYVFASLETSSPIVTSWDWQSRVVSLGVTLESEDGQLAVQLVGLGAFDSLPPTSVASASTTPLARGQSIILSAASSADPDGVSDIESVTWTSNWNGVIWQASGMTVEVTPPPGNHRYYAKVVDSAASTHTSFVDVTVEDR